MRAITFKSGSDKISGNLFVASTPQPAKLAFLLIQGWTGNQNKAAAQALADMGFTSLTYDMRGHGDSEGDLSRFSRADFVNDATIAYDFLKKQAGEDVKIGVIGSSFGSYTAVLLSTLRNVQCLSLRVPATYPDEGFDSPQLPQAHTKALTAWREQTTDHLHNKAFKALHDFPGNIQIIEAENDEFVPHRAVQNYADSVADKDRLTHIMMRGAPHQLLDNKLSAEYVKLLSSWAQQQ